MSLRTFAFIHWMWGCLRTLINFAVSSQVESHDNLQRVGRDQLPESTVIQN